MQVAPAPHPATQVLPARVVPMISPAASSTAPAATRTPTPGGPAGPTNARAVSGGGAPIPGFSASQTGTGYGSASSAPTTYADAQAGLPSAASYAQGSDTSEAPDGGGGAGVDDSEQPGGGAGMSPSSGSSPGSMTPASVAALAAEKSAKTKRTMLIVAAFVAAAVVAYVLFIRKPSRKSNPSKRKGKKKRASAKRKTAAK